MKVLITGVSGFIGFNLAKDLLVSKKNLTVYPSIGLTSCTSGT